MRGQLESITRELSKTRTVRDPAHAKLAETRRSVVAGWIEIAATLDAQGEMILAGDVRYFAKHLPPVLTDRERLAADFLRFANAKRPAGTRGDDTVRDREAERAR